MTEQELTEIEQRANAATPGCWVVSQEGELSAAGPVIMAGPTVDVDFIAHARTDVPALVAEVRRLRALVHQLGMEGVKLTAAIEENKRTLIVSKLNSCAYQVTGCGRPFYAEFAKDRPMDQVVSFVRERLLAEGTIRPFDVVKGIGE